ncbi:uncharacterized protein LOC142497074 isoform X3 [Ascaphus truei]|uniref:uncharacterized protein LOC142497074 isoform X3 n=1 Tax=Ascaphus truei TaxID=8439 RepID=UPI003F592292
MKMWQTLSLSNPSLSRRDISDNGFCADIQVPPFTGDSVRNTQLNPYLPAHGLTEKSESDSQKQYLGVRVRMPIREMLRKTQMEKKTSPMISQDLEEPRIISKDFTEKKIHPNAEKSQRKSLKSAGQKIKKVGNLDVVFEIFNDELTQIPESSLTVNTVQPYLHPGLPYFMEDKASPDTFVKRNQKPNTEKPHPYFNNSHYLSPVQAPYTSLSTDLSALNSLETHSSSKRDDGYCCNLKSTFAGDYASWSTIPTSTLESPLLQSCKGFPEEPHMHLSCFAKSKVATHKATRQNAQVLSFFQFQIMSEEENLHKSFPAEKLMELDENGFLHDAVIEGKRARVYVLAKRFAAFNKINIKDNKKQTALHLAAGRNQHLILKDLLAFGANVNERDSLGKTPLHLCAENGYVKTVEVLKKCQENGMDIQVEAFDNNGLTALHCAVLSHNATAKELKKRDLISDVKQCLNLRKERLLEGISFLLKMGADPLTREPKSGQTSFHLANAENNTEMVSFFQTLYPNMQDTLNKNDTLCTMLQMMEEEYFLQYISKIDHHSYSQVSNSQKKRCKKLQ